MQQAEFSLGSLTILADGCVEYAKYLPDVFAASADRFKDSQFSVTIDSEDIQPLEKYERRMKAANAELFSVTKAESSDDLVVTLLDIGFYLKQMAKPGDLLMVDEPELNLHPENQCRVARLFARLVNIGIKVFITTHSDYIIKELNTLFMLNHDKPYLKRIAKQEGYQPEELISSDNIKVFMAEKAKVKLDGGKNKTLCQTLTPADIDPERGIEARSFDTTIETMNRIQEEIVWGGE